MKVHIRKKKMKDGGDALFLHYYISGRSVKEYLEIHIAKKDMGAREKMLLAEKIRSQRELDLLYGNFGMIPSHRKKTDMIKYFEKFNKAYGKKDIRRFEATLAGLKKFIKSETLPATSVTAAFCSKFLDYLQGKHRGATSFNYFKAFKRVMKEATADKVYLVNPALEVRNKNTVDNQLTKEVLYDNEIAALYKTPCGNDDVKRAFLFACFTGLRGCDVRALSWKQVDVGKRLLKVSQNKTQSQVFLPLNASALALLGKEGSGPVFILPSQNGVNKDLKNWVKRAKIKKHITFHCARHSFITNLLIHGTDLKTASMAAGHSTTRHSEKYTHISDKMKRIAVDALPQLVTSPSHSQ